MYIFGLLFRYCNGVAHISILHIWHVLNFFSKLFYDPAKHWK